MRSHPSQEFWLAAVVELASPCSHCSFCIRFLGLALLEMSGGNMSPNLPRISERVTPEARTKSAAFFFPCFIVIRGSLPKSCIHCAPCLSLCAELGMFVQMSPRVAQFVEAGIFET